jgi:signal transduction histidine kinase
MRAAEAALNAAVSSGQRRGAADLQLRLALLLIEADQLDRARQVLDQAGASTPEPPGRLAAFTDTVRAHLQLACGDLDAAAAASARAAAGWTEVGDPQRQAEGRILDIQIALARGDLDAARDAVSEPILEHASPPQLALVRARAALHLEPPDAARAVAARAVEIAEGHGAQRIEDEALHIAVLVTWQAGDHEAACRAALALAEARRRHATRLYEVRAAAQDAARRVTAQADETRASTGLAADHDEPATANVELLERASHAVRNALARVSACAELLAMPAPPLPRDQLLERLLSALGAVERHIDDAVRDAREGRVVQRHRTRLEPLAHRVLSRYVAEARERGIRLKVIGDQGVFAAAPPSACRDAVSQLVRNGVLYCRRGDTVRVVLSSDGDQAVITVQDDGPGMPADRIAALAEGRTSDAGLGISMVHRAVTSAGGDMKLTGGPGIGTTVELRLPRG